MTTSGEERAGSVTTAPYGAWESPIDAAALAASGRRLHTPAFVAGAEAGAAPEVWWTEGRPSEAGREVVVRRAADGSVHDVLPAPWSARSRVHEYGGRAWVAAPSPAGPVLVFVHFPDQRMYRLDPGAAEPVPLTPAPATEAALRYADLVVAAGGAEVLAVRESHADDGAVTRHVVAVPVDGSAGADGDRVREVVGGSDFLAHPRVSPDGRRLAWLAWNHPDMPWDAAEVRVGALTGGVVTAYDTVLGARLQSAFQPEWAGADALYVVWERTGWWNLYRVPLGGGEPEPLCPREEEFGAALWQLGFTTYAVLADGRLVVTHTGSRGAGVGVLDPATGTLTDLDVPFDHAGPNLSTDGTRFLCTAGRTDAPDAVVVVDPATGATEVVRWSREPGDLPDAGYLPRAEPVTLDGPGGRDVHAYVYRPRNPAFTAPDGERPPYVVMVHGGPTAHVEPALYLAFAYFTSRGIGIVDVNYGGSTGYGQEYRERLREQWGVVDVEDCVAAARSLADRGEADGARLAIQGGSAGGWTVLAALTRTDAFACGVSYFGVAELLEFAASTHDFESRYLDGLIGPLPETRDRYVERAPLTHADEVSCPILLLQGLEDRVVPPAQAEMFRDAMARKGIPYAYLAFEGEQHGFRKIETIVAATEAELSFYGQVMGFEPPGVPRLELEGDL